MNAMVKFRCGLVFHANVSIRLANKRLLASLPVSSEEKDLERSRSEYLERIDIEQLPRAQRRFAKQFEKINAERVKEIFAKNYKNHRALVVLLATVVLIYYYTIHAVKQETFLEEIDEEIANEQNTASENKSSSRNV
ncbi:hypothetical protein AB6A40_010300 [Gnathostoma spinigerum]|uniref:Cytochrome c oxidase assembly factor 3 n=1 Tax=Gnathostoma spinigerum TaxID=75299 RepID=A0ABD6F0V9_9BILA